MAEIPAANGHGTAAALATIYGAVADGSQRVVSAPTMEVARAGEGLFTDLVLASRWSSGSVSGCRTARITGPARRPSATTDSAARPSAPIRRPAWPSPTS